MLKGWEKVSRLGVQGWDELGAKRNAKGNHCSRNSRLGELNLVILMLYLINLAYMIICDVNLVFPIELEI